MPRRYPPHECELPACDVITRNLKYCCNAHAQRHVGDLRISARVDAENAALAQRKAEAERRRIVEGRSLVMVDARGRNPAITLDMIDLGGLPGTAVGAHPWPA